MGTPCEIEGVRALQARQWRRGLSSVDAVVLTIALLCTKSFDYDKLMVHELSTKRGLCLAEVGKVDVVHGRMTVEDRSGATLVDEPVKAFYEAALRAGGRPVGRAGTACCPRGRCLGFAARGLRASAIGCGGSVTVVSA